MADKLDASVQRSANCKKCLPQLNRNFYRHSCKRTFISSGGACFYTNGNNPYPARKLGSSMAIPGVAVC